MKVHRVLIAIGGILFVYNLLVYIIVFVSNNYQRSEALASVETGLGLGFVFLLIAIAILGNPTTET